MIERVVLEVTSVCNNRCLHCYNYWPHKGRGAGLQNGLTRKQIRDLIRQVGTCVSLKQVALSGGEPMLRDDLPEIVCDLTDQGLSTVVITNGTLLTRSRLARFPQGLPFEVTLFSARQELHDRIAGRQVFQRIVEGLVCLEEHGGKLIIACVVGRQNAGQITKVIELGIALGAQAIMLNRVNLSRHTLQFAQQLVPTSSMLRDCLGDAERASKKYGIPVVVSVPIPPCVVDPSDFPGLHFGWCPRGGKDSYYTLGWDGLVRPCNHSSRVLGDLSKETMMEIISGAKSHDFWSPVPEECLQCKHPLKDVCKGGCPAAADECFGSREHIDPIVELTSFSRKRTHRTLRVSP